MNSFGVANLGGKFKDRGSNHALGLSLLPNRLLKTFYRFGGKEPLARFQAHPSRYIFDKDKLTV